MTRRFSAAIRRSQASDDGVLPLINVVFLLLIFFMIAGQLATADPLALEPLKSASAVANDGDGVLISVGAGGRVAVDGALIDPMRLTSTVRARVRREPEVPVRIKADARATTDDVFRIVERLRSADVARVTLLATVAKQQ